jgi:hypothetical protein
MRVEGVSEVKKNERHYPESIHPTPNCPYLNQASWQTDFFYIISTIFKKNLGPGQLNRGGFSDPSETPFFLNFTPPISPFGANIKEGPCGRAAKTRFFGTPLFH